MTAPAATATKPANGIARQLLAAGYVSLRRPNQRNMRNFGFQFYPPIAWLPLSQERENVLPTEMLVQFVQIGSEGHRVGSPQPIQFTSRFFGKLRKVVLSPIDLPEAVAEMSGTAEIDGMDNHTLALGHCDGAVEVRIRGTGEP